MKPYQEWDETRNIFVHTQPKTAGEIVVGFARTFESIVNKGIDLGVLAVKKAAEFTQTSPDIRHTH